MSSKNDPETMTVLDKLQAGLASATELKNQLKIARKELSETRNEALLKEEENSSPAKTTEELLFENLTEMFSFIVVRLESPVEYLETLDGDMEPEMRLQPKYPINESQVEKLIQAMKDKKIFDEGDKWLKRVREACDRI
jgi:hypothetical protein